MVIPCNPPTPDSPPYTLCPGGAGNPTGAEYDVLFVVGPDHDTWSIPAQRALLASKNGVLANIIRNAGSTVRLSDVDKHGFEQLLRYLEGTAFSCTSVSTTRSTLGVCVKFECVSLAQECVQQLDARLNVDNVLEIFRGLPQYCSNAHSHEPSAPELGAQRMSQDGRIIQDWCSALLHNCLIIIDTHCTEIITQETYESLSSQDISTIITRDTLSLKSEYILYESLLRWYRRQCMKLHKPQNPTTRKEILGNLIFKVRYGLLQRDEFITISQNGIFTSNEANEILNIIDNPNVLITDGVYKNINVKRKTSKMEEKCLSSRTIKGGKLKKEKSKSNSTLLNCLTVWTVLFD